MGKAGRLKATLTVSDQEREALERLARRVRVNRHLAFRAKIVLACADGVLNQDVARTMRTTPGTVGKWRKRFVERRVDGLLDEDRPGAPRQISDEQIEKVVVQTLESLPRGRTHCSTRSMAEHLGFSHSTIGRIWRAFGLQPHVSERFQLSTDPLLIEKTRDIVGLYLNPPENAVVLCVDEKSQIQALERSQPVLPMDLGQPERQTSDYFRHGTVDLFAALTVATGAVLSKCYPRHRAIEFIDFLTQIEGNVPAGLDIHVVLDNLATHKTPKVKRWLLRHPRFRLHFTPTHGSWLNQVERFFGLLTGHALRRGSHTSPKMLREAINLYIDTHNENPRPFRWVKTADEILASIARFATRTTHAHPQEGHS
ncbi:MAG: IS630 family transposase [Myxococcaceae bacterium]